MKLSTLTPRTIVVGAGGVGKTTVAAATALALAESGERTLVMTFDPSHRLKDALGEGEVPGTNGMLESSLLDAKATFDGLVERYAPDEPAMRRILDNKFYGHLSGRLAGILEYMAVERLFEVIQSKRYDRVVLDTPPTRQALDFLDAPQRVVAFLDSGALKVALKPWFDEEGRLRATGSIPFVGKSVEAFLDRVVGMGLLREMAEFFQAFGPLFAGFKERALEVEKLLSNKKTGFLLVAGPGEERVPDALFFARNLKERGHRLKTIIVNRLHPDLGPYAGADPRGAEALLHWLGQRDRRGLDQLDQLVGRSTPLERLAERPKPPAAIPELHEVAGALFD